MEITSSIQYAFKQKVTADAANTVNYLPLRNFLVTNCFKTFDFTMFSVSRGFEPLPSTVLIQDNTEKRGLVEMII